MKDPSNRRRHGGYAPAKEAAPGSPTLELPKFIHCNQSLFMFNIPCRQLKQLISLILNCLLSMIEAIGEHPDRYAKNLPSTLRCASGKRMQPWPGERSGSTPSSGSIHSSPRAKAASFSRWRSVALMEGSLRTDPGAPLLLRSWITDNSILNLSIA